MDGRMVLVIIWLAYTIVVTLVCFKQGRTLTLLRKNTLDKKTDGKIIIDHSDPDGPYIFLNLSEGVSELSRRKLVYLEVDNNGLSRD